jgi:hypothetical protein
MFIKDYRKLAQPIAKLVQGDQEFVWDTEQEEAMKRLKQAITESPALCPLNYDIDTDIVLAVDTSWMAVGLQIYQMDLIDKFKRHYAKFASITLNRRESRFSQPKQELYGLKRALEACNIGYWGAKDL